MKKEECFLSPPHNPDSPVRPDGITKLQMVPHAPGSCGPAGTKHVATYGAAY